MNADSIGFAKEIHSNHSKFLKLHLLFKAKRNYQWSLIATINYVAIAIIYIN